jgi:hypothetical protein
MASKTFYQHGCEERNMTSIRNRTQIFRPVNNKIRCATSRTVPGSIPGGVTGDFFRGSFWKNHVSWGRLSLWKWVPRISPGVKAAGAFGWRPTTLIVPKVVMTWGLNLTGTSRATSACRGIPLLLYNQVTGWYISGREIVERIECKKVCIVLFLKCT